VLGPGRESSAEIGAALADRIVEAFGHLAAIREALWRRRPAVADAPVDVAKLSETLAGFVTAREWLEAERAERVTREACEKAT